MNHTLVMSSIASAVDLCLADLKKQKRRVEFLELMVDCAVPFNEVGNDYVQSAATPAERMWYKKWERIAATVDHLRDAKTDVERATRELEVVTAATNIRQQQSSPEGQQQPAPGASASTSTERSQDTQAPLVAPNAVPPSAAQGGHTTTPKFPTDLLDPRHTSISPPPSRQQQLASTSSERSQDTHPPRVVSRAPVTLSAPQGDWVVVPRAPMPVSPPQPPIVAPPTLREPIQPQRGRAPTPNFPTDLLDPRHTSISPPPSHTRRGPSTCASTVQCDDYEKAIKVTFFGPRACGKTSIIKRYVMNTFTPNCKSTIGAEFSAISVVPQDSVKDYAPVTGQKWARIRGSAVAKQPLTLHVVDIAGQENTLHYTRHLLQAMAVAFIVVHNSDAMSFEVAKKVRDAVMADYPRSNTSFPDAKPVLILAVNHCDEGPCVLSDEEIDDYVRSNGYNAWRFTSAKEGTNITALFDEAIGLVLRDERLLNMSIPAKKLKKCEANTEKRAASCCP